MCKIENYKKGFIFSFNYKEISNSKRNILNILTEDCIKNGILEISVHGEDIKITMPEGVILNK